MLCTDVLPTALMHQSVYDSTRLKYATTLQTLLDFCDGAPPDAARIENFLTSRFETDKGRSLQQYISHLNYFHQLGILPRVHTPRIARLVKGACRLDEGDQRSTKLNLSPMVVLQIRRRAAQPSASPAHIGVACQCAVGLRGGEMARAESWHVVLEESSFIIPPSKHDRSWKALAIPPTDTQLFAKLQQCLPFNRGSYPRLFRQVCREYQTEATPHDARRFFATSQQCLQTPLPTIAHFLRHRSTKATAVYLRTLPKAWRTYIQRHFHSVPAL